MDILNKILSFISNDLASSSVVIGLALEFAMRLFKSEKPMSFMHMIAGIVKMLASIFSKLADFLDKVLPQNIKPK